jgi:hypothetical protein
MLVQQRESKVINLKKPLTKVSGLLYLYDKLYRTKPLRWECGGVIHMYTSTRVCGHA